MPELLNIHSQTIPFLCDIQISLFQIANVKIEKHWFQLLFLFL